MGEDAIKAAKGARLSLMQVRLNLFLDRMENIILLR